MPRSHKGQKYVLCIIDEVNNYLITVPIYQSKVEETGDALIENIITKHCIQDCIIMDQDGVMYGSALIFLCLHNKYTVRAVVSNKIIVEINTKMSMM